MYCEQRWAKYLKKRRNTKYRNKFISRITITKYFYKNVKRQNTKQVIRKYFLKYEILFINIIFRNENNQNFPPIHFLTYHCTEKK